MAFPPPRFFESAGAARASMPDNLEERDDHEQLSTRQHVQWPQGSAPSLQTQQPCNHYMSATPATLTPPRLENSLQEQTRPTRFVSYADPFMSATNSQSSRPQVSSSSRRVQSASEIREYGNELGPSLGQSAWILRLLSSQHFCEPQRNEVGELSGNVLMGQWFTGRQPKADESAESVGGGRECGLGEGHQDLVLSEDAHCSTSPEVVTLDVMSLHGGSTAKKLQVSRDAGNHGDAGGTCNRTLNEAPGPGKKVEERRAGKPISQCPAGERSLAGDGLTTGTIDLGSCLSKLYAEKGSGSEELNVPVGSVEHSGSRHPPGVVWQQQRRKVMNLNKDVAARSMLGESQEKNSGEELIDEAEGAQLLQGEGTGQPSAEAKVCQQSQSFDRLTKVGIEKVSTLCFSLGKSFAVQATDGSRSMDSGKTKEGHALGMQQQHSRSKKLDLARGSPAEGMKNTSWRFRHSAEGQAPLKGASLSKSSRFIGDAEGSGKDANPVSCLEVRLCGPRTTREGPVARVQVPAGTWDKESELPRSTPLTHHEKKGLLWNSEGIALSTKRTSTVEDQASVQLFPCHGAGSPRTSLEEKSKRVREQQEYQGAEDLHRMNSAEVYGHKRKKPEV